MRNALGALARGRVHQPLRTIIRPPGAAGMMALMPAYLAGGAAAGEAGATGAAAAEATGDAAYGLKAICIFPGNPAAGLDSHQGVVLLSSAQTGEPLAVLNASAVTEIRTAAVSAVATELLATDEASTLAIVGTGVQARSHLAAIAATRPLAEVRIAGSSTAKAAKFASDVAPAALAGVGAPAVPVVACDSARDAVAGAGIVVTATSSPVPVVG